MTLSVKVTRRSELCAKKWSGGVTTQLAIWPEGADYGERRFDWRISSAAVEDDKSTFTPLPGVHRHIMTLEGVIGLCHESVRERTLRPLADVDEFEGDWKTTSVGRCVDFNLMTKKGCCGEIFAVKAGGGELRLQPSKSPRCWLGIYSLADGLAILIADGGRRQEQRLEKGDFMLISYSTAGGEAPSVTVCSDAPSVPAVCAKVWTGEE